VVEQLTEVASNAFMTVPSAAGHATSVDRFLPPRPYKASAKLTDRHLLAIPIPSTLTRRFSDLRPGADRLWRVGLLHAMHQAFVLWGPQ
jgi:hypothetical protein